MNHPLFADNEKLVAKTQGQQRFADVVNKWDDRIKSWADAAELEEGEIPTSPKFPTPPPVVRQPARGVSPPKLTRQPSSRMD